MRFRKTISIFEMALMISLSFAVAGILSREMDVWSKKIKYQRCGNTLPEKW